MPGLAIDKASFTSQLALDAASDAFSDPPPDLTDDQSLQDQEESSSELSDPPEGLLEGMCYSSPYARTIPSLENHE